MYIVLSIILTYKFIHFSKISEKQMLYRNPISSTNQVHNYLCLNLMYVNECFTHFLCSCSTSTRPHTHWSSVLSQHHTPPRLCTDHMSQHSPLHGCRGYRLAIQHRKQYSFSYFYYVTTLTLL